MPLDTQQAVYLTDAVGRVFGEVVIERIERDRVFGRFRPASQFAAQATLFDQFEEAVNEQLFVESDRLGREIEQLGLRLTGSDPAELLTVCDVQIMNRTAFCCRIPNLALTQIRRAVA